MIGAFIALGGGILFDSIKRFHVSLLPFILYGLLMVIVGFFPHKPINPSLNFNEMYHNLHGIFASIAGTLLTVGLIWQGFRTNKVQRAICFYMAAVCLIFPVLMLSFPNYQGIIQRVMYLQIFGWLW